MADFLTFANLQTEVGQAIKDMNAQKAVLIKGMINQVYLNEIPFFDSFNPLFWLMDFDDSLSAKAPAVITGISKAAAGVITAAHSFVVGDVVSIYGIVGMTELNERSYVIGTVPVAGVSFTLKDLDSTAAISTTNFTTWVSGGIVVHRGLSLATSGLNVQTLKKGGFAGYKPMDPIGIDELEDDSPYWSTDSTSRPKRYYHRKSYSNAGAEVNQLLWFPGSDAPYKLKYWFEKRLTRLASEGDVPLLPPQFQETIVAGAVTRLAETNVQVENAVVWPSLYKLHQDAIIEFNRNWWEKNENVVKQKAYLL